MARSLEETFRHYYKLYTSDLSLQEIERLVKRDAPGIYEFYSREVDAPDQREHPITRSFSFVGNMFMAFLLKLTPARRMFYTLLLLLFMYGFVAGQWTWASLAFICLNVLLAFELADKLTAKDELEMARDIQMGLMPKQAPACQRFDIACFSEAARDVGGDYYDFIQPASMDDTTYIVIGDVSGKGMGAALYMVQVQAILRNLAEQFSTPREVLESLNRNLKTVLRPGAFFTISMAKMNAKEELVLCRAGHTPLLHYRHADATCREIIPAGIGIGLPDGGKFDELLEEVSVDISPGDILLFYTDGVVETMNSRHNPFDDNRLQEVISANADKSAAEIKDGILTALARFRGAILPHDDVTMIVMKAR